MPSGNVKKYTPDILPGASLLQKNHKLYACGGRNQRFYEDVALRDCVSYDYEGKSTSLQHIKCPRNQLSLTGSTAKLLAIGGIKNRH